MSVIQQNIGLQHSLSTEVTQKLKLFTAFSRAAPAQLSNFKLCFWIQTTVTTPDQRSTAVRGGLLSGKGRENVQAPGRERQTRRRWCSSESLSRSGRVSQATYQCWHSCSRHYSTAQQSADNPLTLAPWNFVTWSPSEKSSLKSSPSFTSPPNVRRRLSCSSAAIRRDVTVIYGHDTIFML